MKLTWEDLEKLLIEMEEQEQLQEMMWAYMLEHEEAGDRE